MRVVVIVLALAFALMPACVCSETEQPGQTPTKVKPKGRVEVLREKPPVRLPQNWQPLTLPQDARPAPSASQ
jgi:hypothetical protein